MTRADNNHLVLWAIALLVVYVAGAIIMPWGWFSAFFSAAQMVAGVIVFLGWAPDAWRVFRERRIEASHLALLGVTMLAAGMSYSGAFSLAWALANRPESWVGTPFSSFGRALVTGGFLMFIISPEATREGIRRPRWYVVAISLVAVGIVAFLLGLQWDPAAMRP
ncbi:hypothetical protein [Aureimonas populi]|uniref:Permease n=1 Tax=Aureimonas populi TaxID=1701758 RepID=A0ABW5CFG1_9HYPH|nr:hypothetical protein [Aureimonas populi]